ncbi:MAG: hypothetical protein QOF47_2648, partial [Mycobacterium sp.]|nr:hypothetical protein [Mycobacterium sp.]
MIGDDVSSGYVDLSRRSGAFRKRYQSGRRKRCCVHLEIAQLMKCSRQKADEREKYGHDTAWSAQPQFSELAGSGFHFAGRLTKSMSKSNVRD